MYTCDAGGAIHEQYHRRWQQLSLFSRAGTVALSPHANSRALRHVAANVGAKRSPVPRSALRTGPRPRPRDWLVPVLAVGLMIAALASPARASTGPSTPTGTVVAAMSTSAYGSVLVVGGKAGAVRLAGYPLYENSADSVDKFGCTTKLKSALDIYQGYVLPMSCTGPDSDMANTVASDDWPALSTTGAPVAGAGVDGRLLGSVYRPGIGRQVTYARHPLYVFHADAPFAQFQGEGFLETVLPMPPWHALWNLVFSRRTTRSRHCDGRDRGPRRWQEGARRRRVPDQHRRPGHRLRLPPRPPGLQRLHRSLRSYLDPGPHNRDTSCRFGRGGQGPWRHPPAGGHQPGDV